MRTTPATRGSGRQPSARGRGPDRRFEAVVFDWDGTAVADRRDDARHLAVLVEELSALGMHLAIVSGTNLDNVDGQLRARPRGPGAVHLLLNRGSEVFEVGRSGPVLLDRRVARPEEDLALTDAAELTTRELGERGLDVRIVSGRLNRCKIDLIPEAEWADPPKARIADLLAAVEGRLRRAGLSGLPEVVEIAYEAAEAAGLSDARVTSDVKHVEIGLTDKSDSAQWVFGDLRRRGIRPGLVLLAGDEFGSVGGLPGSDSLLLIPEGCRATAVSVGVEPGGVPEGVDSLGGGPAAFVALLEDQLCRREQGHVPGLDRDEAWTLEVRGFDPRLERVHEALLTIADGSLGTSGIPIAVLPFTTPRVLANGVYTGEGPETELLECPVWNLPCCDPGDQPELLRALDLETGLLHQEARGERGDVESVTFASLARPGIAALRARGLRTLLEDGSPLVAPDRDGVAAGGGEDGVEWIRAMAQPGPGGVAAAASETLGEGEEATLDRLAAYAAGARRAPTPTAARRRLAAVRKTGFEALLTEHRGAWARRWADADVVVEGDPELQLAVRVALFHLIASVASSGEAALGARGLSGPGYRGHVFWDADVYVLPFLAATHPPAARTMLDYRLGRLPAAQAAARRSGRAGARFPWESAARGGDVTPRSAHDRTGRLVSIRTGELEEHVTADVAWAASFYGDWAADRAFLPGPGLPLLIETARYWASRIELDGEGGGHIRGVIGPDEYHEDVDDDAFTNVMARWNLRRAADVAATAVPVKERKAWSCLADALVDNYDPDTRLYEQFDGFFGLEPLVLADVAPRRPVAAEALLGAARVQAAQVVKQADVLMLHHLVPDEVVPGSLLPNLSFYEPRTAHGSSLSPGVHASLFARAGQLDRALDLVRLTSRIDLDDLTDTTADGLHLAAMGSLWQAIVFGFGGIRAAGELLAVDPRLPDGWEALELRLRFHGSRVRLRAEGEAFTAAADPPVGLCAPDRAGTRAQAGPAGVRFRRAGDGWEVDER